MFELTKAQKEELQQELEAHSRKQAIAKQEEALEEVEVVYGRQSGKRG
jgi:allophanate hydrolase subunit 1